VSNHLIIYSSGIFKIQESSVRENQGKSEHSLQASCLRGEAAKEGKRRESSQQHLRNLNSIPSTAVAPRCLSCQFLANQHKPETRFNVTNVFKKQVKEGQISRIMQI